MKIRFSQSGGFAGLVRGCEVDSSALSGELGKSLEFLCTLLGSPGAQPGRDRSARDATNYRIEVIDGKTTSEITFDDTTAPPPLYPLLTFLINASKPLKP